MPKNKTPDLADWQIRHSETGTVHAVVRASGLQFHGNWAVLTDTSGQPLHSVPPSARLTIRRLEPGEPREVPPSPARAGYPPSVKDLEAPPVAPLSAPAEPQPAPALPRRAASKRGRPATA